MTGSYPKIKRFFLDTMVDDNLWPMIIIEHTDRWAASIVTETIRGEHSVTNYTTDDIYDTIEEALDELERMVP